MPNIFNISSAITWEKNPYEILQIHYIIIRPLCWLTVQDQQFSCLKTENIVDVLPRTPDRFQILTSVHLITERLWKAKGFAPAVLWAFWKRFWDIMTSVEGGTQKCPYSLHLNQQTAHGRVRKSVISWEINCRS